MDAAINEVPCLNIIATQMLEKLSAVLYILWNNQTKCSTHPKKASMDRYNYIYT